MGEVPNRRGAKLAEAPNRRRAK